MIHVLEGCLAVDPNDSNQRLDTLRSNWPRSTAAPVAVASSV